MKMTFNSLKFLFAFLGSLLVVVNISATSYYFNAASGNDQNAGKSPEQPFKTLSVVSLLKLHPGDSLLLSNDMIFRETLELQSVNGSEQRPVVITSYGTGQEKATIDARNFLNAVLLENCSHINLQNLRLTANGGLPAGTGSQQPEMRCGVLVKYSRAGNFSQIHLKNLQISDIFYENKGYVRNKEEVKTANGNQNYGWGIRFNNENKDAILRDVRVEACTVKNVSHTGIKFTTHYGGITNILLKNDTVMYTGGPGMQMSGVKGGLVDHNFISHSGSNDDSRKWGRGSGLWTWGSSDIIIQHNQFIYANGPGDSAGCHIDFNCSNVVVQYNLSAHNAGGFCEILGNNYNCAYRYNISVDDGYRVRGQNGAFQEGKIFWLSGYVGNHQPPKGPFNTYFYNNTIYVSKDITAKIAVAKSANGVCVVNNIFVFEGSSREVEGDQFVADKKAKATIPKVIFENNLYLTTNNWPESVLIQDRKPIYGNPEFKNAGGLKISDYVPRNINLIKHKGIQVPCIPGDSIGLKVGLLVKNDILGARVLSKPDMGAIEISQ